MARREPGRRPRGERKPHRDWNSLFGRPVGPSGADPFWCHAQRDDAADSAAGGARTRRVGWRRLHVARVSDLFVACDSELGDSTDLDWTSRRAYHSGQ